MFMGYFVAIVIHGSKLLSLALLVFLFTAACRVPNLLPEPVRSTQLVMQNCCCLAVMTCDRAVPEEYLQ